VSGPVFSINFLAIGLARTLIAIFSPPSLLSSIFFAGRIIVIDPSGNDDKNSSKSSVK